MSEEGPEGQRAPLVRGAALASGIVLSAAVSWLVLRGHESHWLTLLWLASIALFVLPTIERSRPRGPRPAWRPRAKPLLIAALVLLPSAVRLSHHDSRRGHTDEFLTGSFSVDHDFKNGSFFASMPEPTAWLARFPKPYFAFQRLFFEAFGESPFTVRLSVQPYVIAVSLLLFLTVRRILGERSAVVSVVLYAFFSPSVYLESLGLHFISSTAAFMAFFYFAVRDCRSPRLSDAAWAGVFCGACYLTYYSSYIALPVFLVFFLGRLLLQRRWIAAEHFAVSLAGVFVVVAPFLLHGMRQEDHLLRRTNQVSLLTGEWSPHREPIQNGASPIPIVRDNLALSLKSLYEDGLGGHGGYDFGHLAFFEPFSLGLFLAGSLLGLVAMFRRPEIFLVLLVIAASFLGGMVLTIAPPAYHRASLAFPFLAIVMTIPFWLVFSIPRIPGSVLCAAAGGALLIFAGRNELRFQNAVMAEKFYEELAISRFLNDRFPRRDLYIAAFPGYGFESVYRWVNGQKGRRIVTEYHDNLLRDFDPSEKYVYIMIFPKEFESRFEKADPKGKVYPFSSGFSVFAN